MNDNSPVRDSVEAFVAKLDAFASAFTSMASTPEQVRLAEQFSSFVETVSPLELGKAAMPAIVRDYQAMIHREMDLGEPEF